MRETKIIEFIVNRTGWGKYRKDRLRRWCCTRRIKTHKRQFSSKSRITTPSWVSSSCSFSCSPSSSSSSCFSSAVLAVVHFALRRAAFDLSFNAFRRSCFFLVLHFLCVPIGRRRSGGFWRKSMSPRFYRPRYRWVSSRILYTYYIRKHIHMYNYIR